MWVWCMYVCVCWCVVGVFGCVFVCLCVVGSTTVSPDADLLKLASPSSGWYHVSRTRSQDHGKHFHVDDMYIFMYMYMSGSLFCSFPHEKNLAHLHSMMSVFEAFDLPQWFHVFASSSCFPHFS